jgi:hypothetical protein
MILIKLNWTSKTPLPEEGRFNFGDTYRVADLVLNKGKVTKACTLEAMSEHESKVSQLQLVCNATAVQVEVAQNTRGDFRWLAQMRGTPIPNQPQMFYYRTPEELSTQKLWRIRLKFLFSSVEGANVVRIQSMDMCFDNLTRRTMSRSGSQLSLSRSGSQLSMSRSASQLSLSSAVPADGKTETLLKKVNAELKSEGTASCSTATPTGSRTPTSDGDVSDLGSFSSAADKSDGFSSTGSVPAQEGGHYETKKTSPVHRVDSSSSLDSNNSSISTSTTGRRRSRREVGQQQKVMADFVAVVDGVISSLTAKPAKDQDPFLIQELVMLRDRVQVHANQESLDSLDLSADVGKLNSLLSTRLTGH